MPHVSGGSGGDDLASDEIKEYKLEGDEEKRSSELLTDIKSDLVTGVEEDKNTQIPRQSYAANKNAHVPRPDSNPLSGKTFDPLAHSPFGYVVSAYPHPNGTLGPVSMASKVSVVPSTHPFMMYNTAQPPPAHMGISPVHIDPKTESRITTEAARDFQTIFHSLHGLARMKGITRSPMYPLGAPGQYAHPVFGADFAQQALQWHASAGVYPMGSSGFPPGGFSAGLPVTTANLPRFSPPTLIPPPPGLPGHPGIPHAALVTPGPKQEVPSQCQENHRHLAPFQIDQKPIIGKSSDDCVSSINSSSTSHHLHNNHNHHNNHHNQQQQRRNMADRNNRATHIKKPLNAFMLYMKEMRAKVVAECTLKESAAINQILGRRWHSLSRQEQEKYYEMAKRERQLHMQLYPGWSARDNYAQNTKKKKRKRDKTLEGEGSNMKKCRARFGLDQQSSWCKPCRRKKKCIRYLDGMDTGESEDNMGSVGSVEAPTPDSKSAGDSDHDDALNVSSDLSLSSPKVPNEFERHSMLILPNHASSSSSSSSSTACSVASPMTSSHPLSVEQLTQPHCPSKSTLRTDGGGDRESTPLSIPQLPTPPSMDNSTSAAPPMLTVT